MAVRGRKKLLKVRFGCITTENQFMVRNELSELNNSVTEEWNPDLGRQRVFLSKQTENKEKGLQTMLSQVVAAINNCY